MSEVPFERLFSMSAFEALRGLIRYRNIYPDIDVPDLIKLILKIDADFGSLDFQAGLVLIEIVQERETHTDGNSLYQDCIETLILRYRSIWARTLTLGRRKFVQKLSRDEQQCFREAGLLVDPPVPDIIVWWDRVAASVRQASDLEKLGQARVAEKLSLERERVRLKNLGINRPPEWVAIEDNTAGYDVLSFDLGPSEPVNRLIEVKSTISSPLRFFLTRNEWEQAKRYGNAYHFHIWNLATDKPTLYERSVEEVQPHVPNDNHDGKWKQVEIPLGAK